MIVHIMVGVTKQNGKWIGRWSPQTNMAADRYEYQHEVIANRREELERKLDKALRLAFPKANYIVQHRDFDNKEKSHA